MLTIHALTKAYQNRPVLQGLSLEVPAGKVVALLGPNGAGKTTTFRAITGSTAPDSGSIQVGDIDALRTPQEAKAVLGIAPQEPTHHPFLTGAENLELYGKLRGLSPDLLEAERDTLLRAFRLYDDRDRMTREYSEGMKQKLSIACAALGAPSLVLLDESFTGLDPHGVAAAKSLVRDLTARGSAVLFTTHVLPLAGELSDKILFLSDGRVGREWQGGELDALRKDNGLETAYLDWFDSAETKA